MAKIPSRGSVVFDSKMLAARKSTVEDIKKKNECRMIYSEAEEASPEHPIMILDNPEKEMKHHQNGSFVSPERRNSFQYKIDDMLRFGDVLAIDRRFSSLLKWLGENQLYVRLSGKNTDEGFAVYKIRAIYRDGNIQTGNDAFLQMVIGRLLLSRPEEEKSAADADEDEEEQDDLILSDMSSIMDFLSCAAETLPANIRRWAQRNILMCKTTAISPEERRHAQRALSMMLQIQWRGSYFASIDAEEARRILDEELYGMDQVKQRIIETIIQINRTHTLPAYGLLLAGPAGVGKSQLSYAVARILKLPWTALDMSAIKDAEALTGSPRVYANAKPGLIMEAFSQAGSSNQVFIINELDKADAVGSNGNPADALLTLLDNLGYTDNYMECMIPTGGVYPIATANDKSRISAPLMSRFAVIDIPDYTPEEKQVIFTRFALPKILKRMGMQPEECVVTDEAAAAVVRIFASQPGCRDLEQAAEHLAANALYQIETKKVKGVVFDAETVEKLLRGESV
ncbi:MAG: AAA family ATPase [Eubacteriales bacterium]|nr:AAA family ATPase [Eubacteriales bacterium]